MVAPASNRRVLLELARRRQRPGSGSLLRTVMERPTPMSWPDMGPALDPLPWAVVGAVATRLYMPERATRDLDIAVAASDVAAARQRLAAAGWRRLGELSIAGSSWESPDGEVVDLIEGQEPWWPQALVEAQTNRRAGGLPTLPLPYLVLMKLRASRVQDLADLSRMLGQADEARLAEVRAAVAVHAPADTDDLESLIQLGRLESGKEIT